MPSFTQPVASNPHTCLKPVHDRQPSLNSSGSTGVEPHLGGHEPVWNPREDAGSKAASYWHHLRGLRSQPLQT